MKLIIIILTIALIPLKTAYFHPGNRPADPLKEYLQDSLGYVTKLVKSTLGHRYMEGVEQKKRTDIKGWEGVEVTLYSYSAGGKKGKVYLCDAPDERIARWVITACWLSTKTFGKAYIAKLIKRIDDESGGQFPVMGVVWEDMEGPQVPYVFKDGVTVFPKAFSLAAKTITNDQIEACLNLTDDSITENTGCFGRIGSTIREEYSRAGGKEDVGISKPGHKKQLWLKVVRELYKKALTADNNELITDWAMSNIKGAHKYPYEICKRPDNDND